MKKIIIIKADVNDADYITSQNDIIDKEIELIKPLVKALKITKGVWDDRGENQSPEEMYVDSKFCSQKAFDFFNDELLPHMDNEEIHTIESIQILEVSKTINLL